MSNVKRGTKPLSNLERRSFFYNGRNTMIRQINEFAGGANYTFHSL